MKQGGQCNGGVEEEFDSGYSLTSTDVLIHSSLGIREGKGIKDQAMVFGWDTWEDGDALNSDRKTFCGIAGGRPGILF